MHPAASAAVGCYVKTERKGTKMDKKLDMVLFQCPIEDAPTIANYKNAMDLLMDAVEGDLTQLEPVQYAVENTFAGGFITSAASESIDYLIREGDPLGQRILAILGNVQNESEDGVYKIEGLNVAIFRS